VASIAERGYTATRLTDLVKISGVSRNSFYSHFADKEACFVAALEEMLATVAGRIEVPADDWPQLVREAAENFGQMIVAQPAAARMCLLEVYAVGPAGLRPLEEAMARFEAHALEVGQAPPDQAGTAAEMVAAGLGAVLELTRSLLRRDRLDLMPRTIQGFVDVALTYIPPPQPLRLTVRLPTPAPESLEGPDPEVRALRALAAVAAEKGYSSTTINDVVRRASMSPTTFYSYFSDKEDALLAALDSAGAEMVAAIMPAFRRSPEWTQGVRAAIGAFLNFLAARPALARLVLVEVHAAGPRAVERREQGMRPLELILAEGRARAPEVTRMTIETITAAISALADKRIREQGPESLPGLAPVFTYLTLLPFVGPAVACAAANGDGRRRSRAGGPSDRFLASRILAILGNRTATLEQIADELDAPADAVHKTIDELLKEDQAIVVAEGGSGGDTVYRTEEHWVKPVEWEQTGLAERQQLSRQVEELISGDIDLALDTGTFDARIDRHMSRVPLLVDERGWRELASIHTRAFEASLEVRVKAMDRLRESGGEPIDARSVQLLFEVPPSSLGGHWVEDPRLIDPLSGDRED
jgi:AcrR family transcriptional regulator